MRESIIQTKITKALELHGWLVHKVIQSSKNGWPDLECFRSTGVAVFIECKQPGKKARDLQEYRHKQIREQGFEVIVADKVADVQHLFFA